MKKFVFLILIVGLQNLYGADNQKLTQIQKANEILLKAVIDGDEKQCESAVLNGADLNIRDDTGNTLLHIAANKNRKNVVDWLLAHGAEVNARNKLGGTPLHRVADKNSEAVIESLLAKGAMVNARSNRGQTPIFWNEHWDEQDVIDKLKILFANGADLNIRDDQGNTLLHIAVNKNRKDVVDWLLANGAEVNAKNKNGATPLHYVADKNSEAVIESLLAKGAMVNARDNMGKTPIFWNSNVIDKLKILFAKGADLNIRDYQGNTLLHDAVYLGEENAIEWLLAQKVQLNLKNNFGLSPLEVAAQQNKMNAARLLLEAGALMPWVEEGHLTEETIQHLQFIKDKIEQRKNPNYITDNAHYVRD